MCNFEVKKYISRIFLRETDTVWSIEWIVETIEMIKLNLFNLK